MWIEYHNGGTEDAFADVAEFHLSAQKLLTKLSLNKCSSSLLVSSGKRHGPAQVTEDTLRSLSVGWRSGLMSARETETEEEGQRSESLEAIAWPWLGVHPQSCPHVAGLICSLSPLLLSCRALMNGNASVFLLSWVGSFCFLFPLLYPSLSSFPLSELFPETAGHTVMTLISLSAFFFSSVSHSFLFCLAFFSYSFLLAAHFPLSVLHLYLSSTCVSPPSLLLIHSHLS